MISLTQFNYGKILMQIIFPILPQVRAGYHAPLRNTEIHSVLLLRLLGARGLQSELDSSLATILQTELSFNPEIH